MNLQDILDLANSKNMSIEDYFKSKGVSLNSVNIEYFDVTTFEELMKHCKKIHDYRRKGHNFRHNLHVIVFLSILAVFCLAKDVKMIFNFIQCNYCKFKELIEYPVKKTGEAITKNPPSYQTVRRCLEDIEPEELETCIDSWVKTIGMFKENESKKQYQMNSELDVEAIAETSSKKAKAIIIKVDRNENIKNISSLKSFEERLKEIFFPGLYYCPLADQIMNGILENNKNNEFMETDQDSSPMVEVYSCYKKDLNKDLNNEEQEYIPHSALDGKAIRSSSCKSQNIRCKIVVTEFDSNSGQCITSEVVDMKSNEIPANLRVLKRTQIKNRFFTWDALGTQTENIKFLNQKGGFYVAQLKKNQKNLYNTGITNIEFSCNGPFLTLTENFGTETVTREYYLTENMCGVEREKWDGIQTFGKIRKIISSNGEEKIEEHYYIMNFIDKNIFVKLSRRHWAIENELHWELDNVFYEDKSRSRRGNLPFTLNLIRKLALMFLNYGLKLIDNKYLTIGGLGDILKMRLSLIVNICKGIKFDIKSDLCPQL